MILSRLSHAFRTQNWFAVALEFLIVIAGVVIGFQITAWNEARGERDLEQRYVERLADALETDIAQFSNAIELAILRAEQARQVLAAIEDNSVAHEDPTDFLRGIVTAAYTFVPTVDEVVFEEMISRGDVAIIRAETLRSQIGAYYQFLESYSQWHYLRSHVQTDYMAQRAGVLTPAQERLWVDAYVTDGVVGVELETFSTADADAALERIRERPGMISALAHVESWQIYNQIVYLDARDRAEALLAALRAEYGGNR
ncbi:hypothetical protein V0U79_06055 [Hyphobacterium sp. HN65]|uniref:Uncharacterized protein n=1 Tax=Hyphobacterium lacteum TaxID=3116575 RepID=A0ABU7LPV2_9PROT|nr:hypothetical protein [Hyphobacterium sp. HN65]MEE2525922.1 hypothetical protein [Hyphobacterium sp. HN65]